MAAAITHLAKSAAFTPSGGSAWNLTDLADLADGESGDISELVTDNSQVVNGMFANAIKGDISITCKDLSHSINAGCAIGSVGSLAIRYGKRAAGKGLVASADVVVTYANAIVKDIRRNAGVTGDGTFSVVFGAYGTDGSTVKTASVA